MNELAKIGLFPISNYSIYPYAIFRFNEHLDNNMFKDINNSVISTKYLLFKHDNNNLIFVCFLKKNYTVL